jgi:hypothetical protein
VTMKRSTGLVMVLAAAMPVLAGVGAPSAPDPAYLKSFDKWKVELVDDLKKNWLPLAGLFWLKPGQNSFGTD